MTTDGSNFVFNSDTGKGQLFQPQGGGARFYNPSADMFVRVDSGSGGTAKSSLIAFMDQGNAKFYFIKDPTNKIGLFDLDTSVYVYQYTIGGPLAILPSSGRLLVGTTTDDASHLLQVNGTSTFAGAANFATSVTSPSIVGSTTVTTPKIIYTGSVIELTGTGSPESVVTAAVGSIFHRTDGGASTTLYVKESGSGNTGWVAYSGGGTIGGTTGSTDNAILRADGTGGSTIQGTGTSATIDDAGNATFTAQVHAENFRADTQVAAEYYVNKTGGSPITIGTYGVAAGTSPSSTLAGGSSSGKISITTGSAVSLTGTLAIITLPQDQNTVPLSIVLFPANANAATVSSTIWVSTPNTSPSQFQINVTTVPLTSATQYDWFYTVIGYPN